MRGPRQEPVFTSQSRGNNPDNAKETTENSAQRNLNTGEISPRSTTGLFGGTLTNTQWLFVMALGLAGVALRIWDTSLYGPGIHSDSTVYLSAAKSLAAGSGYRDFSGAQLTIFPPVFPAIVAIISLFGFDIVTAARYVNAGVFGGLVTIFGVAMFATVRLRSLAAVATVTVLASPSLAYVTAYATSEPIYLLFSFIYLRLLATALSTANFRPLLWAAFVAALCVMTRYVGVTLIATGGLLLLVQPHIGFWFRIRRGLIFGVLAALPLAAWLLRNMLIKGNLAGTRLPSKATLSESIDQVTDTLASWLLPGVDLSNGLASWLVAVALIVLAGMLIFAFWQARPIENRRDFTHVLPECLYTVIFLVFLVVSSTILPLNPLHDRLISPVFLPLFFLGFIALDRIVVKLLPRFAYRHVAILPSVAISLWLIFLPLAKSYTDIERRLSNGAGGFATKAWDIELMRYLKGKKLRGVVYCNSPEALYHHTGIICIATPSLRNYGTSIDVSEQQIAGLHRSIKNHKAAFLIWFENYKNPYRASLPQLKKVLRLVPMRQFDGGTLYTMFPR